MQSAQHDEPTQKHPEAHPPPIGAEHWAHLFDDQASMVQGIAAFIRHGLEAEGALVVVTAASEWDAVVHQLDADGISATSALEAGRITFCDSRATLERIMRHGRPDAQLFAEVIGRQVAQLAASSKHVWIYGDLADRLAAEGDFRGAHQLEVLWNDLAARHTFTLLCGYSAVNFGNPRTSSALKQICNEHSDVRSSSNDGLSAFLISRLKGQ